MTRPALPSPSPHATALPAPRVLAPQWSASRLIPLWRHGVWFAAMFVVAMTAIAVRLDVQQLHKDLDRHTRLQREAVVLNERLSLELDARSRAVALEVLATQLELGPTPVVRP